MARPFELLPPTEFRRFVELNVALGRSMADPRRRTALETVLAAANERLAEGVPALVRGLPRLIGEAMKPFGWLWNGFYLPSETGELVVGPAFGPPVCASLESSGGPLSSGMCFDAFHLNQTLAAYDVKRWPGYVSCDATSGLATRSGIVCPLRGPDGRPIAVWDLDATQPIEPGDVRFFDVLFATLSRCAELSPADFAAAP